jgi:hypothetical protein
MWWWRIDRNTARATRLADSRSGASAVAHTGYNTCART